MNFKLTMLIMGLPSEFSFYFSLHSIVYHNPYTGIHYLHLVVYTEILIMQCIVEVCNILYIVIKGFKMCIKL